MRVACLGDSDTYGYGLPSRLDNCYPAQLEKILKRVDSGWETRNFGVNGATVLRNVDTSYWNLSAYRSALEYEPDIAVFHFGGNASRRPNRGYIADHYFSDYSDLIDSFAQLPSNPVIFICQTKGIHSMAFNNGKAVVAEQLVPLIPEIASAKGLPLIDLYSVFSIAPELYQSDGVHLNVVGTKLMAEMVAASILGMRWAPDFNGDSTVDIKDLTKVIENWSQNEPALDVAPPPLGDGIVDVLDLEVVMRHWEQVVGDPMLAAHWALDETEGDVAYDSSGANDAILLGGPTWQPADGQVAGAIELDGFDDLVNSPAVLKPGDGVFSIFTWIKGGAPGQVILSQEYGVNWLMTDPADGVLRTDLREPATLGRNGRPEGPPLICSTVITDGRWHRIGFVWDGINRILYVDDLEVARDTAHNLELSVGGLYIGAGGATEPGTYFSGLIDDVRIYNRVLMP
jgi:lysophospholipase L1-like esterase